MVGNIIGIFAALFLGVAAYFAYASKGEYTTQIEKRQNEQSERDAAIATLKKTTEERDAFQVEYDELLATRSDKEAELATQKERVAEMNVRLEEEKSNLETIRQEIVEKKEILDPIGDPETLISEVRETRASITEHEVLISSEEAKKLGLENTSAGLVKNVKDTRDYIGLYFKQQSNPALNTSIANVHGGLGFVTIKGGDAVGVIKGSKLLVQRGGETIAKLLVTSVEKNIAAADIIPDSLAPDTSVLPGDKVIAEVSASTN